MNGSMRLAVLLASALFAVGCGHQPLPQLPVQTEGSADDRSVLEGEWEYEDGGSVVLRLDEQGNGTYEFKDGRFETNQFGGRIWGGKWYQKENDREGGFRVTLSADYEEGEGTWWYDRIGTNASPLKKGGTFRVTKKTSVTHLRDATVEP